MRKIEEQNPQKLKGLKLHILRKHLSRDPKIKLTAFHLYISTMWYPFLRRNDSERDKEGLVVLEDAIDERELSKE